MMGITSPFEEQLKTTDGVPLHPANIMFVDGVPFMVDPKTGQGFQITIYVKRQPWLSLRDFVGLVGLSGLGWKDSRKIHLYNCSVIREMRAKREFFKYHGSCNTTHKRLVKALDGEGEAPLKVCKVCLNELRLSERGLSFNDFDFERFFNDYGKMFSADDARSEFEAPDDYPADWSEISRQTRKLAGNCCECCGVYLPDGSGKLDVHHKNKIKADSYRRENLVVLCRNCHSKQPHHEHMGALDEAISKLRVQQGLFDQCPNCGG
jgi:hypothetical protein